MFLRRELFTGGKAFHHRRLTGRKVRKKRALQLIEIPRLHRIGIDRLASDNTFEREPAPWIVSGRIEKE